jgi:hypothetical protein
VGLLAASRKGLQRCTDLFGLGPPDIPGVHAQRAHPVHWNGETTTPGAEMADRVRIRYFSSRDGDELAGGIEGFLMANERQLVSVSYSMTDPPSNIKSVLVAYTERFEMPLGQSEV